MIQYIPNIRCQRGQSTVEFIVVCLVMIPLFFGIYYFARYSDIKQTAIQASRYAAFERSWDITGQIKPDNVLNEEIRARFFMQRSDGTSSPIGYRDSSAASSLTSVPLWVQVDNKKLIDKPSDINLTFAAPIDLNVGGLVQPAINVLTSSIFFKTLPKNQIIKAQVDVPLSNIVHFEPLKNIDIKMPAATAIGNGSWNASGAKTAGGNSVCDRVKPAIRSDLFSSLESVLDIGMSMFEDSSPQFAITLPDYVPPGSVRANNSTTPSSTPLSNQDWNACNDAHNKPS
jgi:TadE-like protein